MLMKGQQIPRRGLLVDLDYAIDLKPERQHMNEDTAYRSGLMPGKAPKNTTSGSDKSREPELDKEFARGQRTVSLLYSVLNRH